MWWFIIYCIIGYSFFTLFYFYISNEYEFPIHQDDFKKHTIIVSVSLFVGLFWPLVIIRGLVFLVNKYKNK